jgi:hypothetical protein
MDSFLTYPTIHPASYSVGVGNNSKGLMELDSVVFYFWGLEWVEPCRHASYTYKWVCQATLFKARIKRNVHTYDHEVYGLWLQV